MRTPAVMFRLPLETLSNLEALSRRLDVSVNIVAKLIVMREVMNIPAMLQEHDRQLANIHQFLRELAVRNEEFLSAVDVRADVAQSISQQLDAVMDALDAIRDASFVRPSSFITDLIRHHDERHVQTSRRL